MFITLESVLFFSIILYFNFSYYKFWITRKDPETGKNHHEVHCSYSDTIKKSMNEFCEMGVLPDDATRFKLVIKDGMDGAGNQLELRDADGEKTMEIFGCAVLKVIDISDPIPVSL